MDTKIACAALAVAALLVAGTPAGAQYSGNSVLNNPAGNSGGTPPVFRPPAPPSGPPSGRYDTPGQRRTNIPGADSNPSMRGAPGAPCPPGAPAC